MSRKRKKNRNVEIYNNYKRKQHNSNNGEPMATEEQKNYITKFVSEFASSLRQDIADAQELATLSSSMGIYQPVLSEQLLQQINYNPSSASSDDIERWLYNPQANDINLRGMSQYLESAVGQYQRLQHYFTDMLLFNYNVLPDGMINDSTYNKNDYITSYKKACAYIGKMNPKNTFNGMALTIFQDGVSFWYKVDNGDSIGFLQLPTDFCRITARTDIGWMGEIDLTYFDRMFGLSNVIPELFDAYKVFNDKRKEGLSGVKLAPYQYFPLPLDKSWIFSFDRYKATKIPPLSTLFTSALDILSYKDLLRDQSYVDLWKVIALKIPLKKDGNSLLMSYKEADEIVSYINSTMPDRFNVFASPFDVDPVNTNQINTLDKTIDLSNNSFYTSAGSSGTLFGIDTKSAKAIQISQQKDFLFSSIPLYAQFNNMVNWFLANESTKYRWKVNFFGNAITQDSDINTALKLVTSSNFPISHLASTCGYQPCEFESLVNLENALGLKEKMKPLVSQFQQGKNSTNESGKEKKDIMDIADATEAVRDTRGDGS